MRHLFIVILLILVFSFELLESFDTYWCQGNFFGRSRHSKNAFIPDWRWKYTASPYYLYFERDVK